MKLDMFFNALSYEEKEELFKVAVSWRKATQGDDTHCISLTPLMEWANSISTMSVRLYNGLLASDFKFLEEVDRRSLGKCRNMGQVACDEFTNLRKLYPSLNIE